MLTRILVTLLVAMGIMITGAMAQRGFWGGCTVQNVKSRYTDQQIGGFLLHDSSILMGEASQATLKTCTTDQRRALSGLLSGASREMERISILMVGKKLTPKDMEKFHEDMEKLRRSLRKIIR